MIFMLRKTQGRQHSGALAIRRKLGQPVIDFRLERS
jgi:hypothetical protein